MMEKVTIVMRPEVERTKMVGAVITVMESYDYSLVSSVPKVSLALNELEDMYNLIGLNLDECGGKEKWGICSWAKKEPPKTDPVFMFTFEREDGHKYIDHLGIHKVYPVIYIKVK